MEIQTEKELKVVLAARVPPEVKERVEQFAVDTKRDVSKAVHYLLDSHPELMQQPQPALAVAE